MKNTITEIRVFVEFKDSDGLYYEALAYVTINSSYEIEDIRFSIIECFDETGESTEVSLSKLIKERLEILSGNKALEKVQSINFEIENERE